MSCLLFNWALGLVNGFGLQWKRENQVLFFGTFLVVFPCWFYGLGKDLATKSLSSEPRERRKELITYVIFFAFLMPAWILGLWRMNSLITDEERLVFGGILLGLLGLTMLPEDFARRKSSVLFLLRSLPWRTILFQYVLLFFASCIIAWAFGLIDLDHPTRNLSKVAAFPIAAMLLGYSYKTFFAPGRPQK